MDLQQCIEFFTLGSKSEHWYATHSDFTELPEHSGMGSYPLVYTDDGAVLCSVCATAAVKDHIAGGRQLKDGYFACDAYYEGEPLMCDDCNAEIESAYGCPGPDYCGDAEYCTADKE